SWASNRKVCRREKVRSEERPFVLVRRISSLRRIVHLELNRVRGVLEADHFGHLQLDVAVDEVVVEHAAGLEEGAVLVELLERLAQRAADGRDVLQLGL